MSPNSQQSIQYGSRGPHSNCRSIIIQGGIEQLDHSTRGHRQLTDRLIEHRPSEVGDQEFELRIGKPLVYHPLATSCRPPRFLPSRTAGEVVGDEFITIGKWCIRMHVSGVVSLLVDN
jgi:hypothetical protein